MTVPTRRVVRTTLGGPIRFARRHYTNGTLIPMDPKNPGWSVDSGPGGKPERIGPYWHENSTHAVVGAGQYMPVIENNDLVVRQVKQSGQRVVSFIPMHDETMLKKGILCGGSGGLNPSRIRFYRFDGTATPKRLYLDNKDDYNLLVDNTLNVWLEIRSEVSEDVPVYLDDQSLLDLIDQRIAAALAASPPGLRGDFSGLRGDF